MIEALFQLAAAGNRTRLTGLLFIFSRLLKVQSMNKPVLLLFLMMLSFMTDAQVSDGRKNLQILRNGALLVRLRTSQNLIDAYRKSGDAARADEVFNKQEKENREIAEAFKKNYRFGKVYFFYSNYSEEIKSGNFIHLMNADLQPDSSFSGTFLTGEFGYSETSAISSFVLMDKEFKQISRPFSLVRLNKHLVITQTTEQVVKALDTKLLEAERKQ